MISNEIIIRQAELQMAITSLRALQTGTAFRLMDADDALMNTSISDTSEAVVELYRQLQSTEDVFQRLLAQTILALEAAGVAFERADISAGQIFDELPYAIIL